MRTGKRVLWILIVAIVVYLYFPVQFAKKPNSNMQYILVKPDTNTAGDSILVEASEGMEFEKDDGKVHLIGQQMIPTHKNYNAYYNQIYICYGRLTAATETNVLLSGGTLNWFEVDTVDIAYPVSRDSVLRAIMPKGWVTQYDILFGAF